MNAFLINKFCPRCMDSGVWLTPKGRVETCPRIQLGEDHNPANEAALRFRRAVLRLQQRNITLGNQTFSVAQVLTNYTSARPCPRRDLLNFLFADTWITEEHKIRKLHYIVEELRKTWLLPVGGRKHGPSGYWIITDLSEFKEWFEDVKAAPITQLTTIHRLAKFNFPIFAEQIELEFFNDVEPV
jgi:hypothetical protein